VSPGVSILIAALLLGGTAPALAVEEMRYCVTVRSDEPIEGDWVAAVLAGEATIIVDDAAACAVPPLAIDALDEVVSGRALDLLPSLRVQPEAPAGYDRDLFRHWVDADGDGCDARDEVLIAESLTEVRIARGCRIRGGTWVSVFDDMQTSEPSDLDIDHVVPLAEAWRSGAADWDERTRQAFANDLADERALRAVSASSNRSKSDQDPSEWLPPEEGFHCQYVSDWVAIKVRWDLAVDPAERKAIAAVLADCPPDELVVSRAVTVSSTTGSGAIIVIDERPAAEPVAKPTDKKPTSRRDCDPSYPGVCIQPPPPDLDCGDILQRRFKVKGADPHGFDGDGDGIGCES
jgi:hypothetical protein